MALFGPLLFKEERAGNLRGAKCLWLEASTDSIYTNVPLFVVQRRAHLLLPLLRWMSLQALGLLDGSTRSEMG